LGILLSFTALAVGFALIYVWVQKTDRLPLKVKTASTNL